MRRQEVLLEVAYEEDRQLALLEAAADAARAAHASAAAVTDEPMSSGRDLEGLDTVEEMGLGMGSHGGGGSGGSAAALVGESSERRRPQG